MQRAKNGLVLVEFTKSWGSYSRGRTAGFPDKEAARLVNVIKTAKYKGSPSTAAKAEADVDEDIDIPDDPIAELIEEHGDDWRLAHHTTLKSVAGKITDAPILSKDDAIAAIEAELESRNAGQ